MHPVPEKPKVMNLAVSRTCNINCIMCPINREVLKDKQKFLNFETFEKVFGDGNNFDFLNFVGVGEVFVAKDFVKILNYCFDRKFTRLGCVTNLQLVTPEILEMMFKNKFQQLTVSIDGATKETFEYIRRGASFKKLISTLGHFSRLRKKYNSATPNISIATVAMNSSIHELPDLIKLAHAYSIKEIYVLRLHIAKEKGHILNECLFFNQEKYNRYYDEAVDLSSRLGIAVHLQPKFGGPPVSVKQNGIKSCKLPFDTVHVDVDGVIYPCVCRVYPDTNIGNINDGKSLLEYWHSEEFNNFRKAMHSDTPPKQCGECTLTAPDPNLIESHMVPELAEKVKNGIIKVSKPDLT